MRSILFFISLVSFSFLQAQTEIIAHRGASYLAPENTLAAFDLAWEQGMDFIELDIMMTSDEQIIVFHDENTERLLGTSKEVKDYNYSELKKLPIHLSESNDPKYKGQTIPLLSEVLDRLPDNKTVFIEIKTGEEILTNLEYIIKKHWKRGNIVFISFHLDVVCLTKSIFFEVPSYWLSDKMEDVSQYYEDFDKCNLDGMSLHYEIIDEDIVEVLHDRKRKIYSWTINDVTNAKKMIQLQVDGITTDRPKWLSEHLKK